MCVSCVMFLKTKLEEYLNQHNIIHRTLYHRNNHNLHNEVRSGLSGGSQKTASVKHARNTHGSVRM